MQLALMNANKNNLTRDVYHIQAFTPTVQDIYNKIITYFPSFKLDYNINSKRQTLIDRWPSVLDQSSAIKDWKWAPKYNFDDAFDKYLIPKIKKYYQE